MRSLLSVLAYVGFLSSSFVAAAPADVSVDLKPRQAANCNTPSNRACWVSGSFDINTDYELNTPLTGHTQPYTLVVTEQENWTGPDGVVKQKVMLINGTLPGPTLTANWGDRLAITVVNNLQSNGTSFHWHGIRQLHSALQDGANGVTECPIPPGSSRTYNFLAQQYGTTWYHSHFTAQYGNGVVGQLVINGPASLPYDIDLGAFPISDYYYAGADQIVQLTKNAGPPASDNVLFNGTNINPQDPTKGRYANVTLTPGKRHRLRLINPSVENHYSVTLQNHTMTIISSDLVPVNAQTVNSVFLGVGQRIDVTIDASQHVDNYWFNVSYSATGGCGGSNNPHPAAIFHYAGASGNLPSQPGTLPAEAETGCMDINNLTPVVKRSAPAQSFAPNFNASNTLPVQLDTTGPASGLPLFQWKINGSGIDVDWNNPVTKYLEKGQPVPAGNNPVIVPGANDSDWAFWLIENNAAFQPQNTFGFTLPHPIHLHGHDFLVIGKSDPKATTPQIFNPATDGPKLNGNNPTRRDVTMLPPNGWLIIAFRTDNPGTWLMHCHIAWHVSGGLGLTFIERPTEYVAGISAADQKVFDDNCAAWNNYFPSRDPFPKDDSGLKAREAVWAPKIGSGLESGLEGLRMRRIA